MAWESEVLRLSLGCYVVVGAEGAEDAAGAAGGGASGGGAAGAPDGAVGARGDARRPSEVEGGGWRPRGSAADYTWACVVCCRLARASRTRGMTTWAA